MFDAAVGGRSGTNATEHQWLNCANAKFTNSDAKTQTAEITIDYKNSKMSARAKVAGAEEWNSYDAFTGFPENPDKSSLSMAVYPGTAGANEFVIKDITIRYAVFE